MDGDFRAALFATLNATEPLLKSHVKGCSTSSQQQLHLACDVGYLPTHAASAETMQNLHSLLAILNIDDSVPSNLASETACRLENRRASCFDARLAGSKTTAFLKMKQPPVSVPLDLDPKKFVL